MTCGSLVSVRGFLSASLSQYTISWFWQYSSSLRVVMSHPSWSRMSCPWHLVSQSPLRTVWCRLTWSQKLWCFSGFQRWRALWCSWVAMLRCSFLHKTVFWVTSECTYCSTWEPLSLWEVCVWEVTKSVEFVHFQITSCLVLVCFWLP